MRFSLLSAVVVLAVAVTTLASSFAPALAPQGSHVPTSGHLHVSKRYDRPRASSSTLSASSLSTSEGSVLACPDSDSAAHRTAQRTGATEVRGAMACAASEERKRGEVTKALAFPRFYEVFCR